MTNGNLPKTPTSTIPIRALNDDEKPREKALRGGMDSLSDVELLALLLGSGVPEIGRAACRERVASRV